MSGNETQYEESGHTGRDSELRDSELNWLAFRYVAGELSAEERTAFEAQLDTDQSARAAVAREAELTQAIAVACGSLAPRGAQVEPARAADADSRRFSRSRAYSWMALAAAASLAIGMVLGRGGIPWNNAHDSAAEQAVQELAGHWHAIDAEWIAAPHAEPEHEGDLLARDAAVRHDEGAAEEASAEEIPSWLLAALQSEEPAHSPRREN